MLRNYAGTFKTKEKRAGIARVPLFVLLCKLRPSIFNSVPCERIVQKAYFIRPEFFQYSLYFSTITSSAFDFTSDSTITFNFFRSCFQIGG